MGANGNGIARVGLWLEAFKFLGPIAFALAVAYGTTRFTQGALEQRVISAEQAVQEMKMQHERLVTRDELKGWLESQTRALDRIADDVRALRNTR